MLACCLAGLSEVTTTISLGRRHDKATRTVANWVLAAAYADWLPPSCRPADRPTLSTSGQIGIEGMRGMADDLRIYEFASALFLGMGITAVLQGRLVAREPDFPIPEKALRRWMIVDVLGASTMLVLIGLGEFLVLRVLERGSAVGDERLVTLIILGITAVFVAGQALLQRALAVVWDETTPGEAPHLNCRAVLRFVYAVLGGLLLGGVLYAAITREEATILAGLGIAVFYLIFLPDRWNPPGLSK